MKQKLLFWVIFLLGVPGWARPVPLAAPTQTYDLFRRSSLLEIRPGQLTIDSLLQSPGRYRFVPTQNERIHPNDRLKAYWFRVDVTNQTPNEFFLHVAYAGTERITVYEVADNRVLATRHFGRFVAEPHDDFRYSTLIYPLQVSRSSGTHTLYIYMEGIYTTCLYFSAQSAIPLIGALHTDDLFYGLYYGFIIIVVVYSLLLFIRLGERDTFQYAIWVLFIGLQLGLYRGFTAEFVWGANPTLERYASMIGGITGLLHVLFTFSFLRLRQKAPVLYKLGLVVIGIYGLATVVFVGSLQLGKSIDLIPLVALVEGLFSIAAGYISYRRGFKPALFYLIGNLVFFVSIFIYLQYASGQLPQSFLAFNSIHIGSGIEIILFTLALTYKVNLLKQNQEAAIKEQLRLAEANRQLVEEQNVRLESKVRERTDELSIQKNNLETALATLHTTQEQLIQKEKMASLGELVAGIAHEIQNPLNFVNNFSELSADMLGELREEIEADHKREALALADELVPNLQKITHHGKRVDSVVRSMLQHSRSTGGVRQPTNLNALAGEYLQLAYQGLRAKDETFNVQLITDFDAAIGLVNLMPQEMSRVLLNLYNNAFYATSEKLKKLSGEQALNYQPQVLVRTWLENGQVLLCVKDNGIGIPSTLLNKIYQPFFTTKPTGQGIGLGLSLSYDIITKGHGGQLKVQTEPGLYTEFVIKLPDSAKMSGQTHD